MLFATRDLELRKIDFRTTLAPGQIDFMDSGLRQTSPLEASGTAELVNGMDDIRVQGHLSASFEINCDRCLEPVSLPMGDDFDLVYRPAEAEQGPEEKAITGEDAEVGYYEGSGIELGDVVREQVLLWMPAHVLCSDSCKGICPMCGANRNREACACRAPKLDERWKALENLKSGE